MLTIAADNYIPIDILKIEENERYNNKLDDRQTSAMIKFAVTLPKERWGAIEHGRQMLAWDKDNYLTNYRLSISPVPTKVKARVLQAPDVKFANKSLPASQVNQGRWRIDGCELFLFNGPL
jgi:eukaryotic translation initiation factor 2C